MIVYTKSDFAPMIVACLAAADAVSAVADRRHMCESPWPEAELNSLYHSGSESQKLVNPARVALGEVRKIGEALIKDATDEDYRWTWGHADRVRRVLKCAGITSAQIGGTPSLDWGHAAELRWFADTFTRCGN